VMFLSVIFHSLLIVVTRAFRDKALRIISWNSTFVDPESVGGGVVASPPSRLGWRDSDVFIGDYPY